MSDSGPRLAVRLAMHAWPERTQIADIVLRQATDRGIVRNRYPYLTIRVENGHAVYRVEACDRGVWAATLVEGWVR